MRAGEQDVFHTRQQHTYKVAQIGRRLAENVIRQQPDRAEEVGVHPEVVEAACLAHDLGHPPFGHAAEAELDKIVRKPELAGCASNDGAAEDGYEGNAQTFRILTKLAVRFEQDRPGLDLTRATLAATLKYPWLRDQSDKKKEKKWSAFISEKKEFEWAREGCHGEHKTAEAELMDWADDISYSVHDLEDFHRVGVIPWASIASPEGERGLIQAAASDWNKDPTAPANVNARLEDALIRINRKLYLFPGMTKQKYDGSRDQRRQLRNFCSQLIGRYVRAAHLSDESKGPAIVIDPTAVDEVRLLKFFARENVIGLPALHAQQYGQRQIIRDLFRIIIEAGRTEGQKLLPMRFRYLWESDEETPLARRAADCIASLTENEAHSLHRRLTGVESGSVLDPIVR